MESFLEKMEKQYIQDFENDEDNFDEEDEDEENSQMPTTDVPAPVNRQRVARQSTIVQVNTGALEVETHTRAHCYRFIKHFRADSLKTDEKTNCQTRRGACSSCVDEGDIGKAKQSRSRLYFALLVM